MWTGRPNRQHGPVTERGLVDVFSRPRPTTSKPNLGCSPNTPSNPVSMDGVGVDELSGIYFRTSTYTPSVCVHPPNHAAAPASRPPVPDEADLAACRAERAGTPTTFAVPSRDPKPPSNPRPRAPDGRPQISIPVTDGKNNPNKGREKVINEQLPIPADLPRRWRTRPGTPMPKAPYFSGPSPM